MKIYYGYFAEAVNHLIECNMGKSTIKQITGDLVKIYDWVTVIDDTGKDITLEIKRG